jgi:2-polyprenyl-3-methyl-5-hydroxy-6-metoxy-1,4-benzoquinol methylase
MTKMTTVPRQAHWEKVYQAKAEDEVSWFEASPEISLNLIRSTGVAVEASILDVGGGTSRLVDALLDSGFQRITVLDLSENALATSQARLGPRSAEVDWVIADITKWEPSRVYDVWHDRAAFHFLTDRAEQETYAECVRKAVKPGGHVIIGTFALEGPERCSGLPVMRHDAASIGRILGSSFTLTETLSHDHQTPGGFIQRFQFSRFLRKPA